MALSVTGFWNTCSQASRPANSGVPRPSQAKKDSTTTPTRGSRAKTPKKLSAGTSSQLLGAVLSWLRRPRGEPTGPRAASREGVVPSGEAAAGSAAAAPWTGAFDCPAVMRPASRSCW